MNQTFPIDIQVYLVSVPKNQTKKKSQTFPNKDLASHQGVFASMLAPNFCCAQAGLLPVLNIWSFGASISKVISPQLPMYVRPFVRGTMSLHLKGSARNDLSLRKGFAFILRFQDFFLAVQPSFALSFATP